MRKKILLVILLFSFLFVDATIVYIKRDKNPKEIRIIYISYLEYLNNFYGNSKTINKARIDKMLDNIKASSFNTIMLHTSPFSDAIYPSKIFPYSYTLTGTEGKNPGFDYLDYFIKKAHQKDLEVHAWINPYRIRMDNNTSKIDTNNPAYKLLNTSHVMVNNTGIYYNPASEIVKNLILNQIEEIIDNYDIDGIHFDDYFYVQKDIDKREYNNYIANGKKISLSEFRLYHTNDLISRVYKLIKDIDDSVVFSISPDGNINNNYKYHYADVKTWLASSNYVDMIMPQIYYGFDNQYKPFEETLEEWNGLLTNDEILLIPVLAFYKVGNVDNDAGNGKNEWISNHDIIKRQVVLLRENSYQGFSLFRYDFLFYKDYLNNISSKELKNLQEIM